MDHDRQYFHTIGYLCRTSSNGSLTDPETVVLVGDVAGKTISTGYGAGALKTVFVTQEQKDTATIEGHAHLIVLPDDKYYDVLTKAPETRKESWAIL